MKNLSTMAVLSTALVTSAACADVVTLSFLGSNGTQSGGASFTLNDAGTGTMTIRISNTTANLPSNRDISALFWSFSGAAMDVRSGGANASYLSSSSGGVVDPHMSGGNPAPYSPAQMWAFHDPSNDGDVNWAGHPAPHGALQGLGAAGLGFWAGNNSHEVLASGAAHQIDGPDGVIIRAGTGVAQGGGERNQFSGYVEFTFNNLASWYQSYGGIHNVHVNNASLQFGTDAANPNVGLTMVPLPPAALAGLGTLAGLAAFRAARRRAQA